MTFFWLAARPLLQESNYNFYVALTPFVHIPAYRIVLHGIAKYVALRLRPGSESRFSTLNSGSEQQVQLGKFLAFGE
jgi:hypothetical protein